ncbi:MAG TPA: hypothetical protein VHC39_16260 [Rhizomicrobium sp.]|nr:hypothetical protein [Rhizomicrobium sp.]
MPGTKSNEMVFSLAMSLVAVCWPGIASSQDATPRKFSGQYSFYSGTPGEWAIATKKDTKVAISVDGPLAARMFQSMGSAATQSGSCVDGEVTRIRDELMCTRNKNTGKAECYFGFDLHTGKSVLGTDC